MEGGGGRVGAEGYKNPAALWYLDRKKTFVFTVRRRKMF